MSHVPLRIQGLPFTSWVCLIACLSYWCPRDGTGAVRGAERASNAQRVHSGLVVLYDFHSAEAVVKDRSGSPPLDLRIADPKSVRHSASGLTVVAPTLIHSDKPATKLVESIKQSGAITIEVWVRPANTGQKGPARIVTLSGNPLERNFTLGQERDTLEVRLRTTTTSANGVPAIASKPKSLKVDWHHVVYARDRSGKARLYINGKLSSEQTVGGPLSNWEGRFGFALANELSKDRPWLGTYRLVAIYRRALSPSEVEQNFRAGRSAEAVTGSQALADVNARRFETRIAPLLAKHCLACHDTATKKGKLDLSRKAAALAGGEGGRVIVPGKSAESPLWIMVSSDDMPRDRAPLSADEKTLLQKWLDGGADWSLDFIDPAVYAHGGSQKVYVQRLTVPEYIQTVKSTLGVDIAKEARELLPRDLRADGFRNTAYNLNVDLGHVEAHAKLAEIIVGRIDVKTLARKYTSSREVTDENMIKVIEPLGQRLLRGPLSKEEIATYCGVSTTVAGSGGNFEEALRHILDAMLQSPRFVYRMEGHRGDGFDQPLSQYELASRLSYIIWGGPPDDALWEAAQKNALDRAGVERQARRMLQDRRAVDRSRLFLADWLNLDRLDNLRPNRKRFPDWDPNLAADMREETLSFFEEIVWKQNRPLADLLNAQLTFVTPRLARHYGLRLKERAKEDGAGAIRYDLSSEPHRGGLLTQGSVLTVGGDGASMVARGLFVMHELLRGVVPNPPPCVDTTPVPSKPGLSQRAISELRIANKNCTTCHSKFEPLAFGLEKFGGLGSYHEADEHGNKLRDDGTLLFPGEEKPLPYKSSAELMDLLAKSGRIRESLTWKVTQFALGRPLGAKDARIMAEIHAAAQRGGGTYSSLITAIVTSDLVMLTRTEAARSNRSKQD